MSSSNVSYYRKKIKCPHCGETIVPTLLKVAKVDKEGNTVPAVLRCGRCWKSFSLPSTKQNTKQASLLDFKEGNSNGKVP